MFKNLKICNFRLFEKINAEKLGQINLIGGRSNSGKTTFLEALFLLCGMGNPELAFRINTFRGLNDSVAPMAMREVLLKPLFYQFDIDQVIEISGQHSSLDFMKLEVKVERKNTFTRPLKDHQPDTLAMMDSKDPNRIPSSTLVANRKNAEFNDLHLSYSNELGEIMSEGFLHIASNRSGWKTVYDESPFLAIFVPSRGGSSVEDATRLGDLRRLKQGDLMVDALKIIEPRLQALEENSVSGYPMIWGDIGLSELVPLSMMGEGMTRVARIFLAISTVAGGIVMVDEVENGIHYSVLKKVWRAISDAAERAQVQVFATTHSFECMEAAHEALGDKLMIHRIEEDREGKSCCITLDVEGFAAAIRHGFEVR